MRREWNRRQVLAGLGLSAIAAGRRCEATALTAGGPNERLNLAIVGCGGQGAANLDKVAGENIVALCDVDDKRAADAFDRFPKAKRFHDFRKMLDALHGQVDAVVVSVPDHMHAPISLAAMDLGKHVYCEKPLTWGIDEARRMAGIARQKKLATQMGTQGMAGDGARAGIEVIRSGVLGKVAELHVWTDRRPAGGRRGSIGPATARPYPRAWTGTSGSAWPRSGRFIPPIARSSGGAGRTSAPAPWATWASTTPPCRSPRSTSARRRRPRSSPHRD